MAKVHLFPTNLQFTDINGNPLANGVIYVYVNNTITLTSLYSNSSGTALGQIYASIDINGYTDFYVDSNTLYSVVIIDSKGIVHATLDDFSSIPDNLYATIPDGQLNLSQLATFTANRLIGSNDSGVVSEISASTNLTYSSSTLDYTGTAETNSKIELCDLSVSGVSQVDLSSYLNTAYDIYYVEIKNFVASSSATKLGMQFSTAAAFVTSSYDNKQYGFCPTTLSSDSTVTAKTGYTSTTDSNAADRWLLSYDNSHATNGTAFSISQNMVEGDAYFNVELLNIGVSTSYPIFTCTGGYLESSLERPVTINNWGTHNSTATVDGLRLTANGNFSARILFYGLKNS